MSRRKGFTLIELIVAILFFGIASASIALFYANNSKSIVNSEKTARLEVAATKAYETFKGNLMQRMYDPGGNYTQLVFDSIWEYHNMGDVIFAKTDTISGMVFNSEIVLDSFQFDKTKAATKDEAKTFSSCSRIWATVKTRDLSNGDSTKMQTVFSQHR